MIRTIPKIVVIDGIDNTGKTWLCNELHTQTGCAQCAFPSLELCESKIFRDAITRPTRENREAWLWALLGEEQQVLEKLLKDGNNCKRPIVVDRMWFSSLIYQGDGIANNFGFENVINFAYAAMMKRLGVYSSEFWNIILAYPLTPPKEKDTNEIKNSLDQQQSKYSAKLSNLLLASQFLKTVPHFSNTVIFGESELNCGNFLGPESINRIQVCRSELIRKIVRSEEPVPKNVITGSMITVLEGLASASMKNSL